MKNKKLYMTFGSNFATDKNMFRMDFQDDEFDKLEENRWNCLEAHPSNRFPPYISMEIIKNGDNLNCIKKMIENLQQYVEQEEEAFDRWFEKEKETQAQLMKAHGIRGK